jgi:hypothetical protein
MREILIDIIDHVAGVGGITDVRVTGTAKTVEFDALGPDRTTIVVAKLKTPSEDFIGEFGITRLSTLKGLLNFTNFKTDDASMQVIREVRNEVEQPTELQFSNVSTGTHTSHRFMHPDALPVKAHFKGANWDVVMQPTMGKVQEFKELSSILGSETFVVKTNGTDLVFSFGESEDRASVVFAKDVSGKLQRGWSWPVADVLAVLKLADPTRITLRFSDQGVMQADIESNYTNWSYIIPARMK